MSTVDLFRVAPQGEASFANQGESKLSKLPHSKGAL